MGSCPALPLCLGPGRLRLGDVLLPVASFKEKPCTCERVIILLEAAKYIRTDVMGNVRAVKTAFSAAFRRDAVVFVCRSGLGGMCGDGALSTWSLQ